MQRPIYASMGFILWKKKKKSKKQFLFTYGNVLEIILLQKKNEEKKLVLIMYKSSKLADSTFWKLFEIFILYA